MSARTVVIMWSVFMLFAIDVVSVIVGETAALPVVGIVLLYMSI